jgi:hypothetical protein
MPANTIINLRRGSNTQWSSVNPVLASGEPGYDLTNKILKIGDGINQWASLSSIFSDIHVYIKNNTGSSLTKGQVVYINGAQGDNPTVQLAVASGENTSSKTLGLLKQNLANNEFGYVISEGIIEGIDTDAASAAGDTVWLSPSIPGGMVYGSANKPHAPNHMVFIGYVLRKNANNGKIYVKIQNGFELDELHNVSVTNVTNGQFLQYDSISGLWIASSSGNFTSLRLNGAGVSISGHSHTTSNITDFSNSVSGLLVPYALLNSPNFSGVPTVPTAASGTNTTQIANTEFVSNTINSLIAGKVNKSGDVMTGALQAPSATFTSGINIGGWWSQIFNGNDGFTIYSVTPALIQTDDFLTINGGSFLEVNVPFSMIFTAGENINFITGSGESLTWNGNIISVSGHTHTASNITNFNSSVSGLFPSNMVRGVGISGYLTKWTGNNSVSSGLIYDDGTNIGISNSNPTQALDVSGTLRSTRSDANNVFVLERIGTGGLGIDFSAGSTTLRSSLPYRFFTTTGGVVGGTERLRITSSGDVGIGTVSPGSKLTIGSGIGSGANSNSTSSYDLALHHSDMIIISPEDTSNNPIYTGITLLVSRPGGFPGGQTSIDFDTRDRGNNFNRGTMARIVGGNTSGTDANRPHGGELYFQTAPSGSSSPTTRMFINRDGNIGINTASPSGQLHIIGTGIVSSRLGVGTNTPTHDLDVRTNSVNALYIAQDNNTRFLSFGSNGFINNTTLAVSKSTWDSLASLEIGTTIAGRRGVVVQQVSNQTANPIETRNIGGTPISYITAGGGAYFASGVGIGTTTPSGLLDVAGDVYVRNSTNTLGNLYFKSTNASNENSLRVRSDTLGNLYLDGGGPYLKVGNQSADAEIYAGGAGPVRIGHVSAGTVANQNIIFRPAGTERMRIDGSGNIGIGTASPLTRLHLGANIAGGAVGTTGLLIDTTHSSSIVNLQSHSAAVINPTFNTAGSNLANTYGLYIQSQHTGVYTTTNHYGLYVNNSNLQAGTLNNNYAAVFMGGNVGIGLNNPSSTLHVGGIANFQFGSVSTAISGSNINTNQNDIHLSASNQTIFRGLDGWTTTWSDSAITTYFQVGRASGNTFFTSRQGFAFNRLAYSAEKILFTNQTSNLSIPSGYFTVAYNNNNLLSISTSGNVGVGTNSPSGLLDVAGNLTFNTFTEKVITNTNSGSGVVLSIDSGTVHRITLTNNCAFTMPSVVAGKSFSLFLNSGSGNYTASFSGVLWSDSAPPTITTTANKVDILSFISDGTSWYGSYSQNYG